MDNQVQALDHSDPVARLLAALLLVGLWCATPSLAQQGHRAVPAFGPVYLPDPIREQHPLAQGLLAWWRVIPNYYGAPRLYDLVGSFHATLVNLAAPSGFTRTSRPGGDGEISCDGTDDHLDVGLPSKLNLIGPMSLFAWIRPTSVTSGAGGFGIAAMGTQTTPDQSYGFILGRGSVPELMIRWGDFDLTATTGTTMAINTPYYVGFTRAGSTGAWTGTIYVNGTQRASSGTAVDPFTSDGKLMLCRRGEVLGGYYAGALDEVMIWNRALAASEVKQLTELLTLGAPGLLMRQATMAQLALGAVTASGRRGSFFPFMGGQR